MKREQGTGCSEKVVMNRVTQNGLFMDFLHKR
jgi:hypothetical protein